MPSEEHYEVRLAPEAERDLVAIHHYLVEQQSVAFADRWLDRLLELIESLERFPRRGVGAVDQRRAAARPRPGAEIPGRGGRTRLLHPALPAAADDLHRRDRAARGARGLGRRPGRQG